MRMPRSEFLVSPQFEICYAIAVLNEPVLPIHAAWCGMTLNRLGDKTRQRLQAYGSLLWFSVSDGFGGDAPPPDIDTALHRLRTLDPAVFQHRVLEGILHDAAIVAKLASGRLSVKQALRHLPEAKREWLAYVGLFPFNPESPSGALIEKLLGAPEALQRHTAETIEAFWEEAFAATWQWLEPHLARSRDRAERLFASASLGEFLTEMRLLVEFDEKTRELCALRGGYRIGLDDMECLYFMPSAFNHRRFWSSGAFSQDRSVAFFPFFDHVIELAVPRPTAPSQIALGTTDPVLICKALGDATRFSMLALLAREPRTAAELAKETGLSKPTISHHVFQLRAAGLLIEHGKGKAVELSVNRDTLEAVSSLLVDRLFGASNHQEVATGGKR
jgi:ArsR family transcriptional regulator